MFALRHLYIEKLLALIIPCLVLYLTIGTFIFPYFLIIIGLGHFTMAFLYQFKFLIKTHKYMNFIYYILFIIVLAIIIFSLFEWKPIVLAFSTGIYFVIHAVVDEVNNNNKYYLKKVFRYIHILPSSLLYLSFYFLISYSHFSTLPQNQIYAQIVFYTGVTLFILSFLLYFYALNTNLLFFNILYPIIFFSYPLLIQLKAIELLGIYVVYHYISWYIFYFFKLKDKKRQRNTYITEVILINIVIIIAILLIYPQTTGFYDYKLFMETQPTYISTSFLHFISSSLFFMFKK